METEKKIPKRILTLLMNSLSAGVVPRAGAPYIAIGRKDETEALLSDLENIADGGSALRFLVGRYGSGKSFLLQLIRGFALENGFVTADADLSPERRLCGSGGTGIATYRELIRNLSTKTSPDGGALPKILSKWLSEKQSALIMAGYEKDGEEFISEMRKEIYSVSASFEDKVGGFDLATVLHKYYTSMLTGDENLRLACLRWLSGEYVTRSEARKELGTQTVIGDDNWYDYIKLIASFVKVIGYRGFTVYIDECVNLYKITNRVSRENNYEKILSVFNDTLQGKAPYLGIIFVGTPQFLEDTRRGLFSYEALRSRLAESDIISGNFRNLSGPVIRLVRLTDSELLALVQRLTALYGECYQWEVPLSDAEKEKFLKLCLSKAGADTMITPREIIRSYISLLHVLRQNPDQTFDLVIGNVASSLKAENPAGDGEGENIADIGDFEL